MFMIHTPQTIELYGLKPVAEDGQPVEAPKPEGSITFQHETDDVSKCQMVVRIEDRVYTFNFGTRGPIVETAYEDDATREAAKQADEFAELRPLGEPPVRPLAQPEPQHGVVTTTESMKQPA